MSTAMFLPNYSSISKPATFSLFQLVWHFLKRYGIFYKLFGILCSLDVAALIHRRTVYVYRFLSVGPTYRAMGKVVACTIFTSNISL